MSIPDGKHIRKWGYGCAHSLPATDDRLKLFARQRAQRGFDSTDLWSLDHALAKFLAPRLAAFREYDAGHPASMTGKEWDRVLAKMQRAFELMASDDFCVLSEKEEAEVERGVKLFCRHLRSLWV